MRLMRYTVALLLGVTYVQSSAGAAAQAAPAGRASSLQPKFDVVSIRPVKEDDSTPQHISNPARSGYLKAVHVNLKALMEVAYDLPDLRMSGGPDWTTTWKFSLEAKADPEVDDQLAHLAPDDARQAKRRMIAELLADRFRLQVHTGSRDMPIYAMVVAKGGPKLGGAEAKAGAVPAGDGEITIGPGSDSLEVLAYELSWRLGRPVLDRTGLQYGQKLVLGWQEEGVAAADAGGPSLFTALQEQLGLKLESTRGAVPVLVIDHAEKPAAN